MAHEMPAYLDANAVGRRLLDHLDARSTDLEESTMSLDPRIFIDPELAERERTNIFGRVPTVVAHRSELPNPGDYITTRLANNEVVIVRQADGSVSAFVNACRHRGARLVDENTGHARIFSCVYHGWSYDTDGRSRSVAHAETFGAVDQECLGLVSLPAEERHGLIFVVDSADAKIDVAEWLGSAMDESLGGFGLERYTCFRTGLFEANVNWKAMVDGQCDTYHIAYLHAKTVAAYVLNNVHVWDRLGRHGRKFSARKGLQKHRAEIEAGADATRYVNVSHFILPTTQVLRQPDHFQLLTIIPDMRDHQKARMEIRLLIDDPDPSEESAQLWERNWNILMDVIRDEDIVVNHHVQQAMRNRDIAPLILGRNEVANQMFHKWCAAAAAGEPV